MQFVKSYHLGQHIAACRAATATFYAVDARRHHPQSPPAIWLIMSVKIAPPKLLALSLAARWETKKFTAEQVDTYCRHKGQWEGRKCAYAVHGWEAFLTAIRPVCMCFLIRSTAPMPSPHTPHSADADFFLLIVVDIRIICTWPQFDSKGRSFHHGDKSKQFIYIYFSPRGWHKGKTNHPEQKWKLASVLF